MSEIPFSQGMRSIKPTSARPLLDEGCKIQSKTSRSIISNNKIVDSSGFDGADGNVLEDEHEVGKLSPPRSAVKNAFEKPIAIRNSVDRPPSGTNGREVLVVRLRGRCEIDFLSFARMPGTWILF